MESPWLLLWCRRRASNPGPPDGSGARHYTMRSRWTGTPYESGALPAELRRHFFGVPCNGVGFRLVGFMCCLFDAF